MGARSLITIVISVALCMTGCDFLRHVAGRPDSEAVAAKADSIKAADAAEAARKAVEAAAAAYKADSLAAENDLAALQRISFDEVRRLFAQAPDSLYAIVIGSFGEDANASKLVRSIEEAGVSGATLLHRNGHKAVVVCPTGDIVKLHSAYVALKGQPWWPKDAWILVNQ